MARRPVFLPAGPDSTNLVDVEDVDFEWSPGFAVSQKQKSIRALHEAAAGKGILPILEVSTKSPDSLGVRLSAFNLKVQHDARLIPLEAAFQGSKVFERGGPYTDLYDLEGTSVKRDSRLNDSGALIAFDWNDRWPLEPKTAFYDWLYLHAVHELRVYGELAEYAGFTDIEFNPARSVNCQARSCALYVSLRDRGLLEEVIAGTPDAFRQLLVKNTESASVVSRESLL